MDNEQILIPSTQQKSWGWPAALNFILGGAGAGGYLFFTLSHIVVGSHGMDGANVRIFINFVMPALVCLGFLALTLEAGRPQNILFLLSGIRTSWISRESLAFVTFIVTAVMSGFFPGYFWQNLAMISALTLLICQGFVLSKSRGIPAWNLGIMPVLALSSGLSSGAGFIMILWSISGTFLTTSGFILAIIVALINAAFWLFYLMWSKDSEFLKTTHNLRQSPSLAAMIVIGHLVPVLLLMLFLINSGTGIDQEGRWFLMGTSGVLLLASSTWQKFGIIFSSGCHQEIRFITV